MIQMKIPGNLWLKGQKPVLPPKRLMWLYQRTANRQGPLKARVLPDSNFLCLQMVTLLIAASRWHSLSSSPKRPVSVLSPSSMLLPEPWPELTDPGKAQSTTLTNPLGRKAAHFCGGIHHPRASHTLPSTPCTHQSRKDYLSPWHTASRHKIVLYLFHALNSLLLLCTVVMGCTTLTLLYLHCASLHQPTTAQPKGAE